MLQNVFWLLWDKSRKEEDVIWVSQEAMCPTKELSSTVLNPISIGEGGCFSRKTSSMPQDSKTTKAIALKLRDFSQISISSLLNIINKRETFPCCHGNQFFKSGSLVKNEQN